MPTLPGVQVKLLEGFNSASDNAASAERVLIIAAPKSDAPIISATGGVYNPKLYMTEAAVVADFGSGSDGHVAYVQAVKTGASQIYLSATNSSVASYATDAGVRETEFAAALQYADMVEPDIIVAHGFYANEVEVEAAADVVANFAVTLGTKCHELMRDTSPCIGIMSIVPLSVATPATSYSAADIAAYVTNLKAAAGASLESKNAAPIADVMATIKAVSIDGETVDLGRYLVFTAGEVIVNGQPDTSVFTAAASAVAGHLYACPLDEGITKRPMTNVIDLAHTFTKSQKSDLIALKITPVTLSNDRNIITLDGWTMASPDAEDNDSVYTRLSTMRICNEVIKATRNELDKFVGLQANTARMNSVETKLRSLYTGFKQAGLLVAAEFNHELSKSTGVLKVKLSLVTFCEIRAVELEVAVKIQA